MLLIRNERFIYTKYEDILHQYVVRRSYYNSRTISPIPMKFVALRTYAEFKINKLIRVSMLNRIDLLLYRRRSIPDRQCRFHHLTMHYSCPTLEIALPVAKIMTFVFLVTHWKQGHKILVIVINRSEVFRKTAVRKRSETHVPYKQAYIYTTLAQMHACA